MICGGSGITPVFQVLRAVMDVERDETRCVLLDGNKREEDILLGEEIGGLVGGRDGKAKVVHVLSKPSETWKGERGRIGRELIEREVGVYKEGGEVMVLVCGPEALERSVRGILQDLGWKEEDLLFF